jgi:leucyl-tRNA synthetase
MREAIECVILMLSPIVPHICHALWREMGHDSELIDHAWPEVDESALVQDTIEMVIQVNGKVRGKMQVPADASREECQALALQVDNVQKFVDGKPLRKVIVVPGKLVNIVV